MLTTVRLLDALKADLGGISDYQAARKIGVSKATVSAWRSGASMSDENAHRIAEMLRVPPMYVIACINLERAEGTATEFTWRKATVTHRDESVKRVEELLQKQVERARDGHLKAMAKELETLAAGNGDEDLVKAARKLAQMARRAGASVFLAGMMLVGGAGAPTPADAHENMARSADFTAIYIMRSSIRSRRRLLQCLKTLVGLPLRFATWTRARISSTACPSRCFAY